MKAESDLFEKLVIRKYYHRKGRKVIHRSPQKFDHIYTWKCILETSTLATPCT